MAIHCLFQERWRRAGFATIVLLVFKTPNMLQSSMNSLSQMLAVMPQLWNAAERVGVVDFLKRVFLL